MNFRSFFSISALALLTACGGGNDSNNNNNNDTQDTIEITPSNTENSYSLTFDDVTFTYTAPSVDFTYYLTTGDITGTWESDCISFSTSTPTDLPFHSVYSVDTFVNNQATINYYASTGSHCENSIYFDTELYSYTETVTDEGTLVELSDSDGFLSSTFIFSPDGQQIVELVPELEFHLGYTKQ